MSYQDYKLRVVKALSGSFLTRELVDDIEAVMDNTYYLGALEGKKETLKSLKKLVSDIRDAQDDVFNKDLEYNIEALLEAVDRW